jgi:hypothetical protein
MDIEAWMHINTLHIKYTHDAPKRKRQLDIPFPQLPPLVLDGDPIQHFWIIHTTGDGHCLLHAICMQVSVTYANLSKELQKLLVPRLRRELAYRPELEEIRLSLLGQADIQIKYSDNYLCDADGAAICRVLVRPDGGKGYNLCTFNRQLPVTLSDHFDINKPTVLVYQEGSHFEAVQNPSSVVNTIELNRDLKHYFNAYMKIMFPVIKPVYKKKSTRIRYIRNRSNRKK